MHPFIKMLIGLVLLVGALSVYFVDYSDTTGIVREEFINSLRIVFYGMVPPFVALVGLFIVWLELDEWKIERDLKKGSKK